jgi:hypothetical protein
MSVATVEPIAAIGLESRHSHSGRHFELALHTRIGPLQEGTELKHYTNRVGVIGTRHVAEKLQTFRTGLRSEYSATPGIMPACNFR